MKEEIPFLLKTESIINNLNCSQELKDIALSLVNDKRFVNYLYLIDKINYLDKRVRINMNRNDCDVVWVDVAIFEDKVVLESRYDNAIEYSNIEELLSHETEDFRTDRIALLDRIKNDLAERIEEDVYSLIEEDCPLKSRWQYVLRNFYYKGFYKWFSHSESSVSNKSFCVWSKSKPLMILITEYDFPTITVTYNKKIIFDDWIWSNNDWDIKLDKLFTQISNDTI
jgi:hypothetical protein